MCALLEVSTGSCCSNWEKQKKKSAGMQILITACYLSMQQRCCLLLLRNKVFSALLLTEISCCVINQIHCSLSAGLHRGFQDSCIHTLSVQPHSQQHIHSHAPLLAMSKVLQLQVESKQGLEPKNVNILTFRLQLKMLYPNPGFSKKGYFLQTLKWISHTKQSTHLQKHLQLYK